MPLSKIHNTLTSDHILLDGTDSTGANANSNVILDSSAASTDVGALMSYEAGAVDGAVTLPVGRDDLSLTGGIVQVKQGKFTSAVTITNTGSNAVFADIFCDVDITPTSASNNILLLASFTVSSGTADKMALFKFVGGNTGVAGVQGSTAIGSRTPCHGSVYFQSANEVMNVSMNLLDSPATTDSTNYKIQVAPNTSTGNVFVNKPNFDSDNSYIPAMTSTIMAIEVTA